MEFCLSHWCKRSFLQYFKVFFFPWLTAIVVLKEIEGGAVNKAAHHAEAVAAVDLLDAVDWTMKRSCEEANAEREAIMCQIEKIAAELKAAGECERWFTGADPGVIKVSMKQKLLMGKIMG